MINLCDKKGRASLMKKFSPVVFILVLCLSLCSCAENSGKRTYKIYDTAGTDAVEIKLNNVSFEKEHYVSYQNTTVSAQSGHTFVIIDFSLKNIGKEKLGYFRTVYKDYTYLPSSIVSIDYNDGYTYVVDETADSYNFSLCYDYPTLDMLEPLGSAEMYTTVISVPDEVVENTDASLFINFHLDNSKGRTEIVTYTIR
jgi:hypothetical protein